MRGPRPARMRGRDHELASRLGSCASARGVLRPDLRLVVGVGAVGSFFATGPLVAALIVIALSDGVTGMRALARRVIKWRVSWIWYVAAIAIPILAHVITIGVNRAMGAAAPSFDALQSWFASSSWWRFG